MKRFLILILLCNPVYADGLQVPGGPPTGAAGGGLTGTYPSPTVATVPATAMPALTGDCTTSAGTVATTCTGINGVNQNTAWTSFTPATPTATAGTFTAVSAAINYKQIGKAVLFNGTVTVTTIGTASGRVKVALPTNNAGGFYPISATDNATAPRFAMVGWDTAGFLSIDLTGVVNGDILYFNGTYQSP